MAREPVIRVVFVDAMTGQEISRTRMPLSRLPHTFEIATQVQIGADAWSIVGAEPPTSEEFAATGRLRLLLARGQLVRADEILYSLPTICDVTPVADGPVLPDAYVLHEDDWRQVEFVSVRQADAVADELAAIRAVYADHGRSDEHGQVYAFDAIHVRHRPAAPIPDPPPLDALTRSLPVPDRIYEAVGFGGPSVPASFAMAFGSVVLYGLARNGHAESLCLRTTGLAEDGGRLARHLGALMRERELTLVDWPHCLTLTADNLAEYL
jgi:hypothetical protein